MELTKKIRVLLIALGFIVLSILLLSRFYSFASQPFAVYSESDDSLTFYNQSVCPKDKSFFNGKKATYVYYDVNSEPRFDNGGYELLCDKDWDTGEFRHRVKSVRFDSAISFYDCSGLFMDMESCNDFDLSGLVIDGCEDFASMFAYCSSLETLQLANLNFDAGRNYTRMFIDCEKLREVDFGNTDFSSGESFREMFKDCHELTALQIAGHDFASGTNFDSMFENCYKLSYDCTLWNVSSARTAVSFSSAAPYITPPIWQSGCNTAKQTYSYSSSSSLNNYGLTKKKTGDSGWKGLRQEKKYVEYSYYNSAGELVGKKIVWGDGTESSTIFSKYEDEYSELP